MSETEKTLDEIRARINDMAARLRVIREDDGASLVESLEPHLPAGETDPGHGSALASFLQAEIGESLVEIEELEKRLNNISSYDEDQLQESLRAHRLERVQRGVKLLCELQSHFLKMVPEIEQVFDDFQFWLKTQPVESQSARPLDSTLNQMAEMVAPFNTKFADTTSDLFKLLQAASIAGIFDDILDANSGAKE